MNTVREGEYSLPGGIPPLTTAVAESYSMMSLFGEQQQKKTQ